MLIFYFVFVIYLESFVGVFSVIFRFHPFEQNKGLTDKFIFYRLQVICFKLLGISILESVYHDTFEDVWSDNSIENRFKACKWLVELYGFLNNSMYVDNSKYQTKLHKYLNEAMEIYENYDIDKDEHLMYLKYKRMCTVIRSFYKHCTYTVKKSLN